MTHPGKQDPSHKQKHSASESEAGTLSSSLESSSECDADAGKSGSVTTGAGWLTWLRVIAATVAITFGDGSLTFQSSVDFLQLKVSC